MNLEDLRATQVDERGSDSLQTLPATFYEQAADYLADLRERRERSVERVDDPFDAEEVRQLTHELETAREVVQAIYDRRVGKLVKRASLAAAGMPVDDAGLTEEEQALFADLVARIEANREAVLGELDAAGRRGSAERATESTVAAGDPAGGRANDEAAPGPDGRLDGTPEPDDAVGGVTAETASDREPEPDGGATRPADSGGSAPGRPTDEPERLTVRITADVGEIYGVDDRVYTLDAEDVVKLPSANAKPLLDRGAAQRVD